MTITTKFEKDLKIMCKEFANKYFDGDYKLADSKESGSFYIGCGGYIFNILEVFISLKYNIPKSILLDYIKQTNNGENAYPLYAFFYLSLASMDFNK